MDKQQLRELQGSVRKQDLQLLTEVVGLLGNKPEEGEPQIQMKYLVQVSTIICKISYKKRSIKDRHRSVPWNNLEFIKLLLGAYLKDPDCPIKDFGPLIRLCPNFLPSIFKDDIPELHSRLKDILQYETVNHDIQSVVSFPPTWGLVNICKLTGYFIDRHQLQCMTFFMDIITLSPYSGTKKQQFSLLRILAIVGELSKYLSLHTRQSNASIPWKNIEKVRDLLSHLSRIPMRVAVDSLVQNKVVTIEASKPKENVHRKKKSQPSQKIPKDTFPPLTEFTETKAPEETPTQSDQGALPPKQPTVTNKPPASKKEKPVKPLAPTAGPENFDPLQKSVFTLSLLVFFFTCLYFLGDILLVITLSISLLLTTKTSFLKQYLDTSKPPSQQSNPSSEPTDFRDKFMKGLRGIPLPDNLLHKIATNDLKQLNHSIQQICKEHDNIIYHIQPKQLFLDSILSLPLVTSCLGFTHQSISSCCAGQRLFWRPTFVRRSWSLVTRASLCSICSMLILIFRRFLLFISQELASFKPQLFVRF